MPYKIDWIEAPWLLKLKWWGLVSLSEYRAMVDHQIRYMDAANGRQYWIIDLRESGDSAGSRLEPEIMKEVVKGAALTHPHCGQVAMVHSTVFVRFLTATIVQQPAFAKMDGGVPLRLFETIEAAEQFCRNVAAIDTNRATSCVLPEGSNPP
jgi:hypothetical protein